MNTSLNIDRWGEHANHADSTHMMPINMAHDAMVIMSAHATQRKGVYHCNDRRESQSKPSII